MKNEKLIEEVGKYIDKYYIPESDDISMDSDLMSIFDKISAFRKRRTEKKKAEEKQVRINEVDCEESPEFDVTSMKKVKVCKGMQESLPTNRKIDDLMSQMEETFSQRLLRMIDERGLSDSEVYNKAFVDRRHFSKIRKDVNYAPNKKTVLAFSIALQLSIDEAKDLLGCAGFTFSRSSKTDIIIAYCLQNKIYDMFEVNELLDAYEQPVFGE